VYSQIEVLIVEDLGRQYEIRKTDKAMIRENENAGLVEKKDNGVKQRLYDCAGCLFEWCCVM